MTSSKSQETEERWVVVKNGTLRLGKRPGGINKHGEARESSEFHKSRF